MIMRISRIRSCFVINAIVCIVFITFMPSCIKDADNEEQKPPEQTEPISDMDSTRVIVDSLFKATQAYMEGEWLSEYYGYDPMQDANSAIRRVVVFLPDGTYDSHVQGYNYIDGQQDSLVSYKEFEHEHGRYAFDEEKQSMTYDVEYDSLLNFFNDNLEYYAGKVVQGGGIQKKYDEPIFFSHEKDGKRDWVRIDNNLRSVEDHSARMIYIMKNQ